MKDGEHYCKLSPEGIEEYSYLTGEKTRMILENKSLLIQDTLELKYDRYEFSPNEKLLLLSAETEAIYRHSSKSNFYIYSSR